MSGTRAEWIGQLRTTTSSEYIVTVCYFPIAELRTKVFEITTGLGYPCSNNLSVGSISVLSYPTVWPLQLFEVYIKRRVREAKSPSMHGFHFSHVASQPGIAEQSLKLNSEFRIIKTCAEVSFRTVKWLLYSYDDTLFLPTKLEPSRVKHCLCKLS